MLAFARLRFQSLSIIGLTRNLNANIGGEMAKPRVFISFDFDNDEALRMLLVGQARNPDTPFDLADHSNKYHLTGDWEAKTRIKIKGCDVVCVICGEKTDTATGVGREVRMAQELGVPYFFLAGYKDKLCKFPANRKASDKLYRWTWDGVKALINGAR